MTMIDSIFSNYAAALGGQDIVLTLLAFPFVFVVAIIFYKVAV